MCTFYSNFTCVGFVLAQAVMKLHSSLQQLHNLTFLSPPQLRKLEQIPPSPIRPMRLSPPFTPKPQFLIQPPHGLIPLKARHTNTIQACIPNSFVYILPRDVTQNSLLFALKIACSKNSNRLGLIYYITNSNVLC